MKGICGVLPVKSGTIRYDGDDVTCPPAFELVRRGLAMVPEGRGVFGALTIEENLAMGAYVRNDRAGVRDDVERVFDLFPRLKERRRQTAGTLSGGEQQMLTIARTLMGNPRLLLVDEPTEGLAPMIVEQVERILMEIHRTGTPILLVEQAMETALALAQRVYVGCWRQAIHSCM